MVLFLFRIHKELRKREEDVIQKICGDRALLQPKEADDEQDSFNQNFHALHFHLPFITAPSWKGF